MSNLDNSRYTLPKKENISARWWNWLNGKKTVIGTICMIAAIILKDVLLGIWNCNPGWLEPTLKTLEYFGVLMGGVGMVHKGMK